MKKAVLVCTEHRGVFFGYLEGEPSKERVTLSSCRNVLHWGTDVRGFLGLAKNGPSNSCRVGPSADSATLFDITCVADCSEQAAEEMEKGVWTQ